MSRLHSLALLSLLAGLLVGAGIWLPADAPTLRDRYAESWGLGKSGEAVLLVDGVHLPAAVGRHQMFTPAVCAPASTALSNVELTVRLPVALAVVECIAVDEARWSARMDGVCYAEDRRVWQITDRDAAHVGLSTRFGRPMNRGTCGNPVQAIAFTPVIAGSHRVEVAIGSIERPEVRLAFFVEAK